MGTGRIIGPAPLLEREQQLATLRALVDRACAGEGRVCVIEGSPGLGKTSLLSEARAIAGSAGMSMLAARGGEFEGDFAYGVVHQLFDPLLLRADRDAHAELLSGSAALAAPLFDATQLEAMQGDPGERAFPVLHGLYWLTANLVAERPLLIAVDDLQWVDPPSLRWVSYLARRLESLPLLLVLATRPLATVRGERALIGELLSDPDVVSVHPQPIGSASIALLAREQYGLDADDAFCAALEAATSGNPLFVRALLDAVRDARFSPTAANAAGLREIGARGVERAVAVRLGRLPDEARRLLNAAAILGDGTALALVAALAELDEPSVVSGAVALLDADLLRRQDPVEFSHPVVRTAVYELLDPIARGAMHRRAAALLTEVGALPESVAGHLVSSPLGDDELIVTTLREAARGALANGAADAAINYLERARQERSDQASQAETLVELGTAERRTDGPAAAEHLRMGLELITDPARRGRVSLELGQVLFFVDRIPDALGVLQRAFEGLDPQQDPDLHELLLAEVISSAWWEPETYPVALDFIRKVDLASLHGGIGSDFLLATLAHHEYRLGQDRERTLELARRALASGALSTSGSVALTYAGQAFPIAGLFGEGRALYGEALTQARRRGDVFTVALLLMWRGMCESGGGDLPAALTDLRESLDLGAEHGLAIARPYAIAFLTEALIERGDLEEAGRVIGTGIPEHLPKTAHFLFPRLSRGRFWIEHGDPERGLRDLLELGEIVAAVPFDNPGVVPWRRYAAQGMRAVGRVADARALAERELELARRWRAPHALGIATRTLGLILGGSEGEGLLRDAVELLAGSEARVEHARALVDLGAALRRTNRRAQAREILQEGADLAQAAGAIGLAVRANDEIAATGARPRNIVQTGLDALTASERRVAQQAATGLTNKEIAQALFVTVKTVEVHLSSVYRKLDLSSRAELAGALSPA